MYINMHGNNNNFEVKREKEINYRLSKTKIN